MKGVVQVTLLVRKTRNHRQAWEKGKEGHSEGDRVQIHAWCRGLGRGSDKEVNTE